MFVPSQVTNQGYIIGIELGNTNIRYHPPGKDFS